MKSLEIIGRSFISLFLLGAGVFGFWWMGEPEVETRDAAKKELPSVVTVAADEHLDGIPFVVDGVVVPYRQVNIAPQVSGRIEFKSDNCRAGRAVKQGELLIRIDQRDYELEVSRLGEELKQADAFLKELNVELETLDNQIVTANEQLEIDHRQLSRTNELMERQAASKSEVDAVRRAELASENSLQMLSDERMLVSSRRIRLESAMALVQANLDKAKLALSRTEIRAPLDGVVVSDNVEQDGYAQIGENVVVLQDTSRLDVACKLHMRQMELLWLGQPSEELVAHTVKQEDLSRAYDFPDTPVKVTFPVGNRSYHWDGVMNRFDSGGVDAATRMVPCRAHVDDPLSVTVVADDEANFSLQKPPTLLTGMFVKVRVDARPPIALVRLPPEAIQPGNFVWKVNDGKLQRVDVQIAHSDRDRVIVYQQSGLLAAGDPIVVSPVAIPLEGLEVRVSTESEARGGETASESVSEQGVDEGGAPAPREPAPKGTS